MNYPQDSKKGDTEEDNTYLDTIYFKSASKENSL